MSYGRYNLKYEMVEKFYRINQSYKSFIRNEQGNVPGSTPARGLETYNLLRAAVLEADNDVNFSKYDFVNIVTPTFLPKTEPGASGGGGFNVDGISSFLAVLGPFDEYFEDPLKRNWLTHETGHVLGLSHAYNYQNQPLGAWDVLANSFGLTDDLLDWNKIKLGWLEDSQINCLTDSSKNITTHFLSAIGSDSGNEKLTVVKIGKYSALVVESRRKSNLDDLGPNQEGLLVYRVDTTVASGSGAVTIVSNPNKIAYEQGKNPLLVGTMGVGESVISGNYEIKVIKATAIGDYFSISRIT